MFPIMLETGLRHLKAMPILPNENVDWLPVETCAKSINALLSSSENDQQPAGKACAVHNLVNPRAITWTRFLDVLQEASGVPFVRMSMAEWVAKLQEACESDSRIPGAKLVGFFEDMPREAASSRPTFSTAKTQEIVPALAAAEAMDASLLHLYLDKWDASQ